MTFASHVHGCDFASAPGPFLSFAAWQDSNSKDLSFKEGARSAVWSSQKWSIPVVSAFGVIPLVVLPTFVPPSAAQGELRNHNSVPVLLPSYDDIPTGGPVIFLFFLGFKYIDYQSGVVWLAVE